MRTRFEMVREGILPDFDSLRTYDYSWYWSWGGMNDKFSGSNELHSKIGGQINFTLKRNTHMCTFLVSQKVPGSGELVIMGVNPEKPHYVVGVISCEFYSANNHHY